MRIREALAQLAVAGVESIFRVKFLHGDGGAMGAYANQWLRGSEAGGRDAITLDAPYRQHAVINQAVSTVAADFASVEWAAYPATGTVRNQTTPIDEHEALTWFENPAPGMTRRDLLEASAIFFILNGEAWWNYPDVIIQPRGMMESGRLASGGLELLAPESVVWDTADATRPPILRDAKTRQPIDLETLTLFRAFNPYGMRGIGKIDPLRRDLRADLGAAAWNEWALADRNGMPNLVLKPPAAGTGGATGTPEKREQVRERWESSFPNSRRGIGVSPPGWDVQELGANRKDMEWSQMRSLVREMGLASVGLVPFLAGVLDKANYANAREQKFVYWRGTQTRMLSAFEDKINNDLLPKLGVKDIKLFPKWEMVRAAADDVQQKSETARTWFGLGISKKVINESLEMGWDPDDIEDYEQAYLPINFVPASMAGQTIYTPSNDPLVQDPNAPPAEQTPPAKPKAVVIRQAHLLKLAPAPIVDERASEARRISHWRLHVVRLRVLETPVEALFRAWAESLENKVLDRVKSISGLHIVETARRSARAAGGVAVLDAIEVAVNPTVDSLLLDLADATRALLGRMTPRIRAGLLAGGGDVAIDSGVEFTFNPNDFRIAAKLVEGQLRVRGITTTIREALREELSTGLGLGESASTIANRVMDVMGATKSRAVMIARTEMGIAYSNGRFVGMKQASITRHEWLSARDDRVRDDHAPGTGDDGIAVDVGTPFPHSGLLYPLDPAGAPGQVINCRCTTIPVVTRD